MTQPSAPPGQAQTVRLVASWLVVGIPLIYALYQTIKSILPLFGG
jgi:hypothetical protein